MIGAVRDAVTVVRYAAGMPGFLRHPLDPADVRDGVVRQVGARDEAFLTMLDRAVYRHESSPYRALLEHARLSHDDIARLVRDRGLEATLEVLHDRGVYVSLDEFKGRRPIVRDHLRLDVTSDDFDSPIVKAGVATYTGGSRGARRRVSVDLEHRTDSAAFHTLFLDTFGLDSCPIGVWRAAPPGAAGIGGTLGFAKAGRQVERWFSQTRPTYFRRGSKEALLGAYTVVLSRALRRPIPFPEYAPPSDAAVVARWLAQKCAAGTPALMNTTSSSAVRACAAARSLGLDISGTFFRLGGEPFTKGKAAVIESVGARAVSNYTMTEIGRIGLACAEPTALDDLHLLTNHLAAIQRERVTRADGASVNALLFTALSASAPKVMLNVESDDYGTLETRECGCLLGRLGLTRHLHGIRSYEKLTSEGMTFIGSDLIALVDEVLPGRFGGHPTDYQLVEREVGGLPQVSVVISPTVGPLDPRAVLDVVFESLSSGPAYRSMMADAWRGADTLLVERREPYTTSGGKILTLHIADD